MRGSLTPKRPSAQTSLREMPKPRIEDVLIALWRLRRARSPGCPSSSELMPVVVLEPVHAAGGGHRPCVVNPHGFNVRGWIALVVVQIGKRGAAAEGLLAVPDANIVHVGPGNDQQPCAERLIPARRCTQFVIRDVREARMAPRRSETST